VTEKEMIHELGLLVSKIAKNEELVDRAQDFFAERGPYMEPEVAAYFADTLARKLDMIEYEWDRVTRLGEAIAAGREYTIPEI
jgi:hypothetical protein